MVLLNIEDCPTLGWLGPQFLSIQTCLMNPIQNQPGHCRAPLWPLSFANQQDPQLAYSAPPFHRTASPGEPQLLRDALSKAGSTERLPALWSLWAQEEVTPGVAQPVGSSSLPASAYPCPLGPLLAADCASTALVLCWWHS